MYVYIGFKTYFYAVRHLDSIASYLPTGLHLGFFRSWPFFIPSIQFFFCLPRALFCFGIHFNAILGSLSSAILWTWPYHVSWFCSVSFIIVSSRPICCLIVTFLIREMVWLENSLNQSEGGCQGMEGCPIRETGCRGVWLVVLSWFFWGRWGGVGGGAYEGT